MWVLYLDEIMLWQHYHVDIGNEWVAVENYETFQVNSELKDLCNFSKVPGVVMESDEHQWGECQFRRQNVLHPAHLRPHVEEGGELYRLFFNLRHISIR